MDRNNSAEAVKPRLVTVGETSERLRLCRQWVYNLMDAGDLKWVKLGRSRRVLESSIDELISRNTIGG